jgi:hypothetical protein
MSWAINKIGRASKLAEVVKQQFAEAGSCLPGSAEEAARNALGDIAETLCRSLKDDPVVRISADGSAWGASDMAHSQSCRFTFETCGNFVE